MHANRFVLEEMSLPLPEVGRELPQSLVALACAPRIISFTIVEAIDIVELLR